MENTFTSVAEMAARLFPMLKIVKPVLPYLLHNKWETSRKIQNIPEDCPVLFLSGLLDQIVPPAHMQELYAALRADLPHVDDFVGVGETGAVPRASMVKFPGSGHNAIMMTSTEKYYSVVGSWLNGVEKCGPRAGASEGGRVGEAVGGGAAVGLRQRH